MTFWTVRRLGSRPLAAQNDGCQPRCLCQFLTARTSKRSIAPVWPALRRARRGSGDESDAECRTLRCQNWPYGLDAVGFSEPGREA